MHGHASAGVVCTGGYRFSDMENCWNAGMGAYAMVLLGICG